MRNKVSALNDAVIPSGTKWSEESIRLTIGLMRRTQTYCLVLENVLPQKHLECSVEIPPIVGMTDISLLDAFLNKDVIPSGTKWREESIRLTIGLMRRTQTYCLVIENVLPQEHLERSVEIPPIVGMTDVSSLEAFLNKDVIPKRNEVE